MKLRPKKVPPLWAIFLFTGGVYAIIDALLIGLAGERFSFGKFIFDFLFFGGFMTAIQYYARRHLKQAHKKGFSSRKKHTPAEDGRKKSNIP